MRSKITEYLRHKAAAWLERKASESFSARRYDLTYRLYGGYLALSGRYPPRGRFDTASDAEIARFLDDQALQWKRGDIPLPPFCSEELPASPDALKGLRMLVVVSEYIMNDPRYMKNEMGDHLAETARRAGIDAQLFYVDDCSYPDQLGVSPNARRRLDELRRKVLEFRPDVLFVDIPYVGNEHSVNVEFVRELRREVDMVVIGFLCDAWMGETMRFADYWTPVCDAFYHAMARSPLETKHDHKIVCSGYPVNKERFHPVEARNISASFMGSTPFPRAYSLSAAASLDLPSAHFFGHERLSNCPDIDQYADVMRRSKIVLDFCGPGVERVNGRVWQSLSCGCLLLAEQTARRINHYFVPYVHFVPFANARELRRLLNFFLAEQRFLESIGSEAARWSDQYYGEVRLWSDIIVRAKSLAAEPREYPRSHELSCPQSSA